jgi:hypothetical protein
MTICLESEELAHNEVEARRLHRIDHATRLRCSQDDIEFTSQLAVKDFHYDLGSPAIVVPPRSWHRSNKDCDVTFLLLEEWVNDINVSGNYITNFDSTDGSFEIYSDDSKLKGTALWMKFIIMDKQFNQNKDYFYFMIYFHESEGTACSEVELLAPSFDKYWWDCYEIALWSDLVIEFEPALATVQGCGTISYVISWEHLPPNEKEFSVDSVNH